MTTNLAIEASGLVKTFGDVRAVDGVDLAVRRGSVYGVLGPNGAGKTTTIRMLATLLDARRRHRHRARARHRRRGRRRPRPGQPDRPDGLGRRGPHRAARTWSCSAGCSASSARRPRPAPPSCSTPSASSDAATRLVKNYCGGMRRRLDIAASIVVTPELMFLDEPTTGLDPRSRNQVWDIIRALRAEGTTILLCTQYLDEADQLADGIAVIDHGRVIAEGTPGQLKASVGSGALHVRLLNPAAAAEARARSSPASSAPSSSSPTRRAAGRRAPTPTAAPRRSPRSPAPASAWPPSRSASPASTRSSSPSPATPPRSQEEGTA